jgi:voltage-gated potassium channel Kch
MTTRGNRKRVPLFIWRALTEVWWLSLTTAIFLRPETGIYVIAVIGLLGIRVSLIPVFWWALFKKIEHLEREFVKSIPVSLVGDAYALILLYASIYKTTGVVDTAAVTEINGGVSHDAITSLYFSIVTWTTLGYGDFRPTPQARLVAASEALAGYVVMAILIAAFSQLLRKLMWPPQESDNP